jgi:hypothetical protein
LSAASLSLGSVQEMLKNIFEMEDSRSRSSIEPNSDGNQEPLKTKTNDKKIDYNINMIGDSTKAKDRVRAEELSDSMKTYIHNVMYSDISDLGIHMEGSTYNEREIMKYRIRQKRSLVQAIINLGNAYKVFPSSHAIIGCN